MAGGVFRCPSGLSCLSDFACSFQNSAHTSTHSHLINFSCWATVLILTSVINTEETLNKCYLILSHYIVSLITVNRISRDIVSSGTCTVRHGMYLLYAIVL